MTCQQLPPGGATLLFPANKNEVRGGGGGFNRKRAEVSRLTETHRSLWVGGAWLLAC